MDIGIAAFVTDQTIQPAELAGAVENLGFSSIYFPEHTHIPTSRKTPPATGEAELAAEYSRTLDPFVALAAAATSTVRIKIGTGVCLVAQHDPIVLAKQVATLDLISGGRFVFGIGFGWNREEMENHGVDFRTRRDRVREHIMAMERLWTQERAEFHGQFVHFEESWSWPKPVQKPRPPILIGGAAGPRLFAHVAEYADGWMPFGGAGVRAALPDLNSDMRDAERDPAELRIVVFRAGPERDKLAYYESIGVHEAVLGLQPGTRGAMLRQLESYAGLVRQ